MTMPRSRLLVGFVLILGAAFALRVFRLDSVPLRGDEAYAVQYWAGSPEDVIPELADEEPHPLGTFVSFWAWKQVAGPSEFAMRYFPLLGNLLGTAAIAALAQRLFRSRAIGLLSAALWAANPFLIWHAQDVRNYALWAALSPLAMWFFVRAADRSRPRDWALYVIAEAAALYMFFLEGLLLIVQAAYLLVFRRSRRTIVPAIAAWTVLGLLLVPWLVQLWYLSHSGYEGTLSRGSADQLLTWFFPMLLVGDALSSPWNALFPLAWCAVVALAISRAVARKTAIWLALYAAIPMGAILAASIDMSVFHPRYAIAVTPALLLLTARAALLRPQAGAPVQLVAGALVAVLLAISANTLIPYYRGDDPKSPPWPGAAAYVSQRAQPADLVLKPWNDPAFNYYYTGAAVEKSLTPNVTLSAQLAADLNFFDTIWFVGSDPAAEAFLGERMQRLSRAMLRSFPVTQYRAWEPDRDEIETPASATFGDFARLEGFTLTGPDDASPFISLLLFWEPLAQTVPDYSVFVHLRGPLDPATGQGPIRDQDDHRPRDGFASTRLWEVGSLVRDPYNLLSDPAVTLAPGQYAIEIGFYDPETDVRAPVTLDSGAQPSDSFRLTTFVWPRP